MDDERYSSEAITNNICTCNNIDFGTCGAPPNSSFNEYIYLV